VICVVLPHALLVIRRNNQIRTTADELENAMRIITHEYVSNLDIEKAVENSVNVIEHDKPFREFLVDMRMVSANVERNLRRLESKENNTFFSRWIDQLILTQSDRTQVVNLMPILQDMNDAKTTQRENDTKVAAAWQEYFTMLALILLSPLLIRIIQYEWYSYLVNTLVGKILIVAMLISLVWATGRALKINQPITG
jgi:Trp operon repressor